MREELFSLNPITVHQVKINEYRSFMKNNLALLPSIERESWKYFEKVLENTVKDIDMFTRMRFIKLVLNPSIPRESIDHDLLSNIEKFVEFMKLYYSGFTIEYEGKVLVRFLRDCIVDNKRFRKGDIALIDYGLGFKLYIEDYVELLIEPYFKRFLT